MLAERLRNAVAAVDGFVFAPEDARRLAALRIGLFGLLAYRLAVVDYGFVADQPAALFDPVSLFHLLNAMPSAELTSVAQPLAVLAALLAAAGAVPRLTMPLALALAVFLNLMLNSTGKIVHNDVLLVLCLLPLVASPAAACRAWSVGALRRSGKVDAAGTQRGVAYGWPIRTAMVIIGLSYLIVGLQKLRYSGIDWVTSDNLRWVLYGASDAKADPNTVGLFIADRAWLAHMLAAGTIALEIGFIACCAAPLDLRPRRGRPASWDLADDGARLHRTGADRNHCLCELGDHPRVPAWATALRRPDPERRPGGGRMSEDSRAVVLYDEDCGFCKWSLNKILAWDRRGRLRPAPIQGEEGRRLLPQIPADEHLNSWHLALPSGEVRSAGAAAPFLFDLLPGGRPLAALFRAFPRTTDRAYRFVADHRDRFARLVGVDASCQIRRS